MALAALALAGGAITAGVIWARRRRDASRWARALRTFLTDARVGLLTRRNWPGVLIASIVVLVGHLATFLVAARAAGLSASMVILVPIMVLALLAMGLPVNIGGWGPREGVTAWAFAAAGLGAAQGLTVAVVYGVLAFVASLPGAGVLAIRWLTRVPAIKRRPAQDLADGQLRSAVGRWLQPAASARLRPAVATSEISPTSSGQARSGHATSGQATSGQATSQRADSA
jgi:uncharacterized membrane protein YbhN (UPF0104 family)